jgi:hypothetical protein
MDGCTDIQPEEEIDRPTENRWTKGCMDRQTNLQCLNEHMANIQMDEWTYKERDIQTGKWTDENTDRETSSVTLFEWTVNRQHFNV